MWRLEKADNNITAQKFIEKTVIPSVYVLLKNIF